MPTNVTYHIVEFTRKPNDVWMRAADLSGTVVTDTDELNNALTQRYKVAEDGATFFVGRLSGLASRFVKLKMQTGEIFSIKDGWLHG